MKNDPIENLVRMACSPGQYNTVREIFPKAVRYRIATRSGAVHYENGVERIFDSWQAAHEALLAHRRDIKEAIDEGALPDYDFRDDFIDVVPFTYKPLVQE